MDGVIVDTEPLHRKAYFKMFDEFGINVSEELFTSFTGKNDTECLPGTYNSFQSE